MPHSNINILEIWQKHDWNKKKNTEFSELKSRFYTQMGGIFVFQWCLWRELWKKHDVQALLCVLCTWHGIYLRSLRARGPDWKWASCSWQPRSISFFSTAVWGISYFFSEISNSQGCRRDKLLEKRSHNLVCSCDFMYCSSDLYWLESKCKC